MIPASCSESSTGSTFNGGAVIPAFDEAAAVTETIDTGGGTIQLTTADGTDVTVTVPAGARRSPITLTVVPLTQLDGAPFSALVGAVEIRPSEVMFSAPVTITIRPVQPFVGLGMAFVLDEVDVGLAARAASTQEVAPGVFVVDCADGATQWEIGVGMSGIVGIARSSVLEALDLLDSSPTSLKMRMKAQAAQLIYTQANLERFASGDCDRSILLPAFRQGMIDTYNSMLKPALLAAVQSDGFDYFQVVRAYLSWDADTHGLGIGGEIPIVERRSEGALLLNTAAVNAANKFLSHCSASGFDGLVLSVLGRKGLRALLAAPEMSVITTPDLTTGDLIQRLQDCLGCDDITILDVSTPAIPLKNSFGRFDVNFTGSTTENTQFFWGFGLVVAEEDQVRTDASPVIRLPEEPGTYFGVVFLDNECSPHPGYTSHGFTYTVIDCDDPLMNEPLSVTSVSRIDGAPGTQVTFQAEVSGPVSEYTWDFRQGGVVSAEISHDPRPVVTLGAARKEPYTGFLSVGNACGSSEPFSFEFRVRECQVPIIASVQPASGVTGATVEFVADVANDPTVFAWTFGGGASPGTSSGPRIVVTLGEPGTYTGTLTAASSCGSSETFSFEYTIQAESGPCNVWSGTFFFDDGGQCTGEVIITGGGGGTVSRLVLAPSCRSEMLLCALADITKDGEGGLFSTVDGECNFVDGVGFFRIAMSVRTILLFRQLTFIGTCGTGMTVGPIPGQRPPPARAGYARPIPRALTTPLHRPATHRTRAEEAALTAQHARSVRLYELSPLDAGPFTRGADVNARGRVACFVTSGSGSQAFRWSAASGLVPLAPAVGYPSSVAIGITRDDFVLGASFSPWSSAATLWSPAGTALELPDLGWYMSEPAAISDAGVVVGRGYAGNGVWECWVWDASNGTRLLTSLAFPENADVTDVSAAGLLAGVPFYGEAFLFDLTSATTTGLGTLGGDTSGALAVNEAGHAVGWSQTAPLNGLAPFFWSPAGGMRSLGTPTGPGNVKGRALDVNCRDVVVGTYEVTPGLDHAFVWDENMGFRDLNSVVRARGGIELEHASHVSGSGWIVGGGVDHSQGGKAVDFVLRPL